MGNSTVILTPEECFTQNFFDDHIFSKTSLCRQILLALKVNELGQYSDWKVKAHLIMKYSSLHKFQIMLDILLDNLLVCTWCKSERLLDMRSGYVLEKPTSSWATILHLDMYCEQLNQLNRPEFKIEAHQAQHSIRQLILLLGIY